MNDYDRQQMTPRPTRNSYVPAAPEPVRQPPAVIDAPAWLTQTQPLPGHDALTALEGARESTSAMDRAQALRVRLVPFLLAWGGVGVVIGGAIWLVAGALPAAALVAALTFACLTAVTYYRLNRTDYEYSREGTERHKINTAADLAHAHMANEHELRKMALQNYLAALERHEGKR